MWEGKRRVRERREVRMWVVKERRGKILVGMLIIIRMLEMRRRIIKD